VVVSQVEPGGAADEAGVQRGDVIREVNGNLVRSYSDYRSALAKAKKGEIVRLLIRRGERNLYLTVRNSKGE
jgi:serine protease Do